MIQNIEHNTSEQNRLSDICNKIYIPNDCYMNTHSLPSYRVLGVKEERFICNIN
jgi:hypothetical protein